MRADEGVAREIQDHFTFEAPGAKYSPAFKRGHWDGLVRLYKKGLLYAGLRGRLRALCEERGYEYDDSAMAREPSGVPDGLFADLTTGFEARDYQVEAAEHCVASDRALLLSPTASGKSLIIYALARHYSGEGRVLVIVPTVNLVQQMVGDFRDYGYRGEVHAIRAGESRDTDAPVVVSTWQSIAREDATWVQQFDCVVVDEAHLAKATTISGIMEMAVNVRYRFGFTGTLDGSLTNEMVLEGLFGPVRRVTTTRELMDRGTIATATVKVLTLRHPDSVRRVSRGLAYADEIKYLVGSEPRNRFITNLVSTLRGNTLVLYTRVEQHGKILAESIAAACPGRQVRFIHGKVDAEAREEVRTVVEHSDDAVAVCSYGTFALGVNIKRINNIVLGSPYKSRVLVAQSIGRGLRLADGKTECTVYDVADDLSWRNSKNHTLRHSMERIKLYAQEGFPFQTFDLDLPGALQI